MTVIVTAISPMQKVQDVRRLRLHPRPIPQKVEAKSRAERNFVWIVITRTPFDKVHWIRSC